MNQGVTVDTLMQIWSEDSKIDETEPSKELAKVSSLHAKYLRFRSHHNLIVKKLLTEYNSRKKIMWEYYSGDLNNPEDLTKYNLEPLRRKILRQDIPIYLDTDEELTKILIKKIIHQEIVDLCESILKELNNRTYQLGNIVKWETFAGGGH